jgi:hypothetical protein
MERHQHLFLTALALLAISAAAPAQTQTASETASNLGPDPKASPAAAAPVPSTVTAADFQALKEALAAQQRQIDRLTRQLERQQAWQQAQQSAGATQADNLPTHAGPQPQLAEVGNQVAVPQAGDSPELNLQDAQETQPISGPMEGPLTIHFRGINITPGGYAAGEFVRRSRALGADMSTPFNSLTMPGASQSKVSELFGSARQSKITLFADGRMKNVDLSSYVAADFLSSGVTSTSVQTNGYTLRLRQAWGQAKFNNGWSFVGGQMWSLVTENGKGISPDDDLGRTNDARPKTIDSVYNVGFTSGRQLEIRVTKDFANKVWIAAAVGNSEGTLTTHGNETNFLLGQAGASNSYNTGSTYTFNPAPDVIAKVAFEPGFGHYEIVGLFTRFTDRIYPCGQVVLTGTATTGPCPNGVGTGPSAAGAFNASKNAGGFGASARWHFFDNHIVFGLHGFGGSGIGRYSVGQLSDVSIHANGTVDPIRSFQGLATLEWHGKKLDLYSYAGVEYAARAADFDPVIGKEVGYGAPLFNNSGCYTELPPTVNTGFTPATLANCTADTRALTEYTGGFWYRFYNGPRGRFQFGTQYSYITRQTWSGTGFVKGIGVSPEGLDNMVMTSFRYYLP